LKKDLKLIISHMFVKVLIKFTYYADCNTQFLDTFLNVSIIDM